MNANIKKILASGFVALTLAGSLAAAPAQAKPFPKPFPHPHPHHGFGGWGVGGLIGGLAVGAIAASAAPTYECGTVRQAVFDQYGNFIGYRYVSAC
jgi:predicted lipid-binding transport protein (Tim44 family)